MWERLYAVPYTESPWKERFPYLLGLENDEPAEPRNNVVSGNLYINSAKSQLHRLVKTKGEVKNNRHFSEKIDVKFREGRVRFNPSMDILSKFEELEFN